MCGSLVFDFYFGITDAFKYGKYTCYIVQDGKSTCLKYTRQLVLSEG